jgi:hypothetical protein
MLCKHLHELHEFVKENEIEIGGLDMLRIVCKKCQVQHECPEISADYWQVESKVIKPSEITSKK